ncbi:LacI family DNA-binding transcriptional regulator [Paraglaciecola arctica]|uniref:LacI family DNA-binding transcriptional regulator n=1 Tax=Paraglaciecola arctica TaxID=1128911 RepID=UPI001C06EA06|nr:LacI family transcriptional regulator [Paraglaciecola arctica]
MATIRDVSKETNLSTGTISKAMNRPERVSQKNLDIVHTAIKKLNYKPNMLAKKFRSKTANAIIVLVPDIANLFFAKTIRGIESVARRAGYDVLIGETKGSVSKEEEFIRMVENLLADGVINLSPYVKCNSLLPRRGVFSVSANSCEETPYSSVRIDNVGAAYKIVSHLINLGHKRIGVISGLRENPHTLERMKGYLMALKDNNINFDQSLVVEGDFRYWSGLIAAEKFKNMEKCPSAIFCMNDSMALAAIRGFYDMGIQVPQDISITGFDDLEVSRYIAPQLTTIALPTEKIGEKSAEILIDMIHGNETDCQEYVFPYEFIIRESTANYIKSKT